MTPEELRAELAGLAPPRFDERLAFRPGGILADIAWRDDLTSVIDIRDASRTRRHVGLPGASGPNDSRARRRSNLALPGGAATMAIGLAHAESGRPLADDGLSERNRANHGGDHAGAVPIVGEGAGMVAVARAFGLVRAQDHHVVVRGL